jgi:hypothetical protein
MGHYQKLEEFQITNKKIIDVSELLFSEYKKKVHQVIDKFDKICNPKLTRGPRDTVIYIHFTSSFVLAMII